MPECFSSLGQQDKESKLNSLKQQVKVLTEKIQNIEASNTPRTDLDAQKNVSLEIPLDKPITDCHTLDELIESQTATRDLQTNTSCTIAQNTFDNCQHQISEDQRHAQALDDELVTFNLTQTKQHLKNQLQVLIKQVNDLRTKSSSSGNPAEPRIYGQNNPVIATQPALFESLPSAELTADNLAIHDSMYVAQQYADQQIQGEEQNPTQRTGNLQRLSQVAITQRNRKNPTQQPLNTSISNRY